MQVSRAARYHAASAGTPSSLRKAEKLQHGAVASHQALRPSGEEHSGGNPQQASDLQLCSV